MYRILHKSTKELFHNLPQTEGNFFQYYVLCSYVKYRKFTSVRMKPRALAFCIKLRSLELISCRAKTILTIQNLFHQYKKTQPCKICKEYERIYNQLALCKIYKILHKSITELFHNLPQTEGIFFHYYVLCSYFKYRKSCLKRYICRNSCKKPSSLKKRTFASFSRYRWNCEFPAQNTCFKRCHFQY